MSASAPAGSASSITGKLSAASTSATIDGDDESDVISQPAPTSCIQVPMLETMEAIHRLRNSVFRSGLQGDLDSPEGELLTRFARLGPLEQRVERGTQGLSP